MPTLFKPREEDDFSFVGVYRNLIKIIGVGLLVVSSGLTIALGKGLY